MSSKPVYTLRFVQLEPKTNNWAEVQVSGNSKLVMIEDIIACLFAHGSLAPIHIHQYAIMNDDATIELHFARDMDAGDERIVLLGCLTN